MSTSYLYSPGSQRRRAAIFIISGAPDIIRLVSFYLSCFRVLSGGPHITTTTTSRGTDKNTVPLELHLLFPAVPKGMIGVVRRKTKSCSVRRYCFVDSVFLFFFFFSVVVVREDWRSGRCDPSTDFWTRNSALIQSVVVVVVVAAVFICWG